MVLPLIVSCAKNSPTPSLELAHLRRIEDANLLVVPIQPPLMRLRVVHAQGQTDNLAGRTVPFALVDLRAVEKLAAYACAFEFHPLIRTGQRMQSPLQVILPRAEQRIEVVRAIALRRSRCAFDAAPFVWAGQPGSRTSAQKHTARGRCDACSSPICRSSC